MYVIKTRALRKSLHTTVKWTYTNKLRKNVPKRSKLYQKWMFQGQEKNPFGESFSIQHYSQKVKIRDLGIITSSHLNPFQIMNEWWHFLGFLSFLTNFS